jgi:hypothetical protein
LKSSRNVPTILEPRYHIAVGLPKLKALKRIFLFLATNLAVLTLLSLVIFIIERVFGVHLAGGGLGGQASRSGIGSRNNPRSER